MHSGNSLCLFSAGDTSYGAIYQSGAQQTGLRPSYGETSYGWIFGVRDSRWGITPITDVYSTLGSPNFRFATLYSSVASINTSDRNQKDDIAYLDNDNRYMDLFYKLKPCTYKLKNTDPNVKHDRIHTGFIAQDVEESLQEVGLTNMDFAALRKDKKEDSNGDYIYSLRYSEFISLAVQAIQDLKKVEDLKNQLERR